MTQLNKHQLIADLARVNQRIDVASEQYQQFNKPRLLAVSKKHPAAKIKIIYEQGHTEFGESYVQEALAKVKALSDLNIIWHFIGPIQSNKTRAIAENFSWVQSVDRMKILTRLNNQRPESLPRLNVLLQLKVGDENTKSGASQNEILSMLEAAKNMKGLQVRGLMCIPPPSSDFDEQCDYFLEVWNFYQQLKTANSEIDTLSMGMSGDLEAAIKSGSTMVRVGTDIFGPRV